MDVLRWYNLIFYIPLAAGLLMVLGMALGVAEVPHGVDIDGDGHPDVGDGHDHDQGADGKEAPAHFSPLALLGFGKVPTLLVLMTMAMTFGGTGVIANFLMKGDGGFGTLMAIGVATGVMVVTTSIGSRALARVMPTLETSAMSQTQLVGCTGTVTVEISTGSTGIAQVRRNGELFQITCRAPEAISKGKAILVTDFDAGSNVYDVCIADPLTLN